MEKVGYKKSQELEVFPAKPFQFALYLAFLTQTSKTSAPVEEAVNSISWAHQLAVVEDPAGHPLVKQILGWCQAHLGSQDYKGADYPGNSP